ncbi:MAG: DUF159 family protein [Flavobacteriaceae bacterium]|nr:MAG: DUF159 family protein [Flavobacteriaceae bacterium]
MCYNTKISREAAEIQIWAAIGFPLASEFKPANQISGFSFPKTPVITNELDEIQLLHWGVFPYNNKERPNLLNARVETLEEKRSFKDICNNRCLIIVDGFYEWKQLGKQKIKHEIGFKNQLFALAGIFSTKENYKSYAIITTEAKGIMRTIHNTKLRMPIAFNSKEKMNDWLHGKNEVGDYDFTYVSDSYQEELFL